MKNTNLSINATYEMVSVKNLKVGVYQRVLNTSFAKEIATNFDMNKVGVITVSSRDGDFNVIDGQHRVYSARMAKVPMLMCQVLYGLTYEEEANLFVDLNGIRYKLSALDYFNAEVEAKNKEALDIKYIVEKNGMGVSRGTAKNKINAIAALSKIYKKHGKYHLDSTLQFIKLTWVGANEAFSQNMLRGVSEFISIYKDDIKMETFIRQLKRVEPVKIRREADNDTNNIPKVIKTVNTIFKYYNSKLSKNKLKNKHLSI